MNWETRLKKICETAFPYPPKCCSGTKKDIDLVRQTRIFRYKKTLAGLDEAGQERQVEEWEEKYQVNG
jgi:hypothetical protein